MPFILLLNSLQNSIVAPGHRNISYLAISLVLRNCVDEIGGFHLARHIKISMSNKQGSMGVFVKEDTAVPHVMIHILYSRWN